MGRALPAALALILLTLVGSTCSFSAHNSTSVHIPHIAYANLSYVSASMSAREIRLSAAYCCNLVFSCAEVNNATVEPCAAMQDRVATLSPSLCASDSHNSSSSVLCPPSGAAAICNGGASCCTNSCNESCTSNLDVCTCPCNHCSTCSCCKQVENRVCRLRCRPCDKVWMMLDFKDQLGKPHSANFSCNFSLSSGEAQQFYDRYNGLSSFIGFYKPDDPTIVDVPCKLHLLKASRLYQDASFLGGPEDYPVGSYWVKFGIATAFPIFTVSVILAGLLIALLLQRMRRAHQRPFRIAWSVNRGLWIGIIWPLIIMLLILQVNYPVPREDISLSMLFPQLIACIGWLPLLLLWLYHIMHPQV